MEVRELVVGAVLAQGWTWARAAETYGVSLASVGRFVAAFRAGQASLAARAASGGRPRVLRLPEHVAALRESLEAAPDLELAARCEHLASTEGIQVSVPTLWRAVRALGWTRKKRRSPPANRTPPSAPRGAGRRP